MSSFDPSPGPPNDPNYLRYSKVVPESQAPQPNMSGKIALSTVGEGITGVADVADMAIKKAISSDAYDTIDKERDQFTAGLQKIKSQLDSGVIPGATQTVQGSTTGGLFSGDDSSDKPDLPPGLESGLSKIQQLALAKASGAAKLNDTQYSLAALSEAKKLRAQYGAGYRDYIDQEVSKVSGLPVANSYYQNMLTDINRQMAQMGQKKDVIQNTMFQNLDVPHMDTYITQKMQSDPKYPGDAFVLKQIGSWQNLRTQQQIDAASRAASKDDQSTKVDTETRNLTKNLNDLVSHHIEDNLALSGMPDLRSLLNYFSDVKAGKLQATDKEVQDRAQQLQAYRGYIYQEGLKMSQGAATVIGGKPAMDMVNTALSPIDGYITAANDKDSGSAFYHLHANQAIKEDETNNWLMSHDRGAISRQIMAGRGIFGDQLAGSIIGPMLEAGKDKAFADIFAQEALSSAIPLTDARGQPIPRYISDAIKQGKKASVDQNYYGQIVQWTNRVTDPKMPLQAKDQMIDWAFAHPDLMKEFNMDYRDPNTGNIVPGKYRAFNIMTTPAMVNSIAETAKIHPENYQKFKNWTESSFGELYRSDLQTLDNLTSKPLVISMGSMSTKPQTLNVHFSFNDVGNQFGLVDGNNKPIDREYIKRFAGDLNVYRHVESMIDTVERVNTGITHLSNVQKYDPQGQSSDKSTTKYLLNNIDTLLQNNPSNMAAQAMGKVIVHTQNPEMRQNELNERFLRTNQ